MQRIPTTSQISLVDTISTTETVPFIGYTSGKFIEKLGDAVIGQLQNMVIRRAFSAVKSAFPHTHTQWSSKTTALLYENLLEFAR